MDALLLIAWFALLFGVLPLVVGLVVGRAVYASAAWVVLAGTMAFSQSQADGLGGLWVVVLLVAAAGVPIVLLGTRLRARRAARRS